ncbi:PREDICTED: auxin-responsive protein SAUR41 [Camelina sativa]|uniref:Auxin-responsive protein SAUR41 n=1 Tax=Camelina sativa TaxID=90675 RepID=A0ABM1R7V6_CAMSA|nr:PREDICTED: auxin-responsive protein SAUR41 [Camelina sativa]
MKHLIRRLSRVADSSSEFSIRRSTSSFRNRRGHHRIHAPPPWSICPARRVNTVPAGHVPVYVGEEMERFVVSAELMNHPVFVGLLNRSAQEYGYAQKGVLHIPCHVIVFERVVETLRLGGFEESGENIQDLVASLLAGDDELILETTE